MSSAADRLSHRVVTLIRWAEGGGEGSPEGRRPWDRVKENIIAHRSLFPPDFQERLRSTEASRVVALVDEAGSGEDPRRFAVYVPPENREFWRGGQLRCHRRAFLIPAVNGIPMIFGVRHGCFMLQKLGAFCCGQYGSTSPMRTVGPSELCAHAKRRHITAVFILRSIERPERNELLRCSAGEGLPVR
jgi:hypothetical protein